MVVKSDGRREPFSPAKLLNGLRKACEKRPISSTTLEEIVEEIETDLHQRENREIEAREIGTLVTDRLKKLDPVAYVRFASVYRRFEDVGSFVQEVESLLGGETRPEDGRENG